MCIHLSLRMLPPHIFIKTTCHVQAMHANDCSEGEPSALYRFCFNCKVTCMITPQTPFEPSINRDMLILSVISLRNSPARVYVFCFRSSLARLSLQTGVTFAVASVRLIQPSKQPCRMGIRCASVIPILVVLQTTTGY